MVLCYDLVSHGKNAEDSTSPASPRISKTAQIDPGGNNRRPCAISTRPNLAPSAKNLVYTYSKVKIWFILVVRHTCRVIYVTGLAQKFKNLKICPERPSGAIIDALEGRVPDQT